MERLEAHGYEFKSETDTETVAHLVDYLHTGKQEDLAKTVLQAVQRLRWLLRTGRSLDG